MRHNDISNAVAPIIAFDMDSMLYMGEEEETNIVKKLLKIKKEAKFNRELLDIIRFMWIRYDLSIYLVSFIVKDEDKLNDIYEKLSDEGICVSNIVYHPEWDDVRYRLSNGRYVYFFSSNEDVINYAGKNAYHINDFRKVFP